MEQISYSQGQPSRYKGGREKNESENVWYFQQRELNGLKWQPGGHLLVGVALVTPILPLSTAVGCPDIK